GGAEVALHKLLAAQRGAVEDVRVVSLLEVGPVGARIEGLGIPVVTLGMRPGRPGLAALARLLRVLRRERPQLVQTWMYHADLLGGVAARLLGIPVVWGVRQGKLGPGDKRLTRLARRVCASFSRWMPTAIVCNSHASVEIHVEAGYSRGKFVHIPNGFDLSRFRPDPELRAALRSDLRIPAGAPVVGLVARYHPHKDHATFIRAAARVRERRPDVHFVLCGTGIDWDNPELCRLIDHLSLRPAFHLLGRRDDVERVYPGLDVACLSSATESFPNVLGEAMACGVPCVATDCGEVRELIGDTGRVVPPRDPPALADGMIELLDLDPRVRQVLGVGARERVKATYDIEAVARRFTEVQLWAVGGATSSPHLGSGPSRGSA
ncbi:MAG TPA: glycosyltransferase, partial [Acidimicrobiales bacterium]|nr:glycosyltransferase [Acidimicrobiales bacterium]